LNESTLMNRWSPMGKLGATDRDTTATVIDMTAGAVPGTVANGPRAAAKLVDHGAGLGLTCGRGLLLLARRPGSTLC